MICDKTKDEEYMCMAIEEAKIAFECNEIPVGAVIVKDGSVISAGHNNRESENDATGHAEIVAIRKACEKIGSWRLHGCTLYVTLEPCPMCMGAIINSRISRVVFALKDARAGACGSVINMCSYPLNHKPKVDMCEGNQASYNLLTNFFKQKRCKNG